MQTKQQAAEAYALEKYGTPIDRRDTQNGIEDHNAGWEARDSLLSPNDAVAPFTGVQYVCGFYFDQAHEHVVLIWKNKPAWQKGRLNGVGGKIEAGETPVAAMRREFKEETGVDHEKWVDLIYLTGRDGRVYFFCAEDETFQFEYAQTMEEEEVAKIPVDRLDDFKHIPNLRWLIPMASYKLNYPTELPLFNPSGEAPQARPWKVCGHTCGCTKPENCQFNP